MVSISSNIIDSRGRIRLPVLHWVEQNPGTVILESGLVDKMNRKTYVFSNPVSIVEIRDLNGVEEGLRKVEEFTRAGYFAAGYISYEAGYAFEKVLTYGVGGQSPLLWFGIYKNPFVFDLVRRKGTGSIIVPGGARALTKSAETDRRAKLGNTLAPGISKEEYLKAFERIQDYIVEGDTYQVNFTFKLAARVQESAALLYDQMRKAQRVSYGAMISLGTHIIVSCSPELFFMRDGNAATLKPMKGTVSRGRTLDEDAERETWLLKSGKDRAENRMIVDLLRNDIGKISRPGSVKVTRFFDVERYQTVYQATSTIRATLKKDIDDIEVIRSLFPSGSVTGAPKIRTMQIIRELEKEERGVYTGAIGFFAPKKKSVFSVAIRTLSIERKGGRAEFGIGSGVTHLSEGDKEYSECLLKAAFLADAVPEFSLIETIRWDPPGKWFLLRHHMRRLAHSARYFGFPFDRGKVRSTLEDLNRRFRRSRGNSGRPRAVRLLLDSDGKVRTESFLVHPISSPVVVKLSSMPTNSNDRFLFHKTTNRHLYDQKLQRAQEVGIFDVIFRNEKNEITEGARSNIVVRIGNQYYTPPLASGVLPGTYRAYLLQSKKYQVSERILSLDDLAAADELLVCNALRGFVRATLDQSSLGETDEKPMVAENGTRNIFI